MDVEEVYVTDWLGDKLVLGVLEAEAADEGDGLTVSEAVPDTLTPADGVLERDAATLLMDGAE